MLSGNNKTTLKVSNSVLNTLVQSVVCGRRGKIHKVADQTRKMSDFCAREQLSPALTSSRKGRRTGKGKPLDSRLQCPREKALRNRQRSIKDRLLTQVSIHRLNPQASQLLPFKHELRDITPVSECSALELRDQVEPRWGSDSNAVCTLLRRQRGREHASL